MAKKRSTKSFKYDPTQPDKMEQVFSIWSKESGLFTDSTMERWFKEKWIEGSIYLQISHSKSMWILSNWEVI